MPRDIGFPEVIRLAQQAMLDDMFVGAPGKVVAFKGDRADIELGVLQPIADDEGFVGYVKHCLLPDVPIIWPAFGAYVIAGPMSVGDPVMVHFSDTAYGNYIQSGSAGPAIDTRRHSLGYPVCYPGGPRPLPKALLTALATLTALTIGVDGGNQIIEIDATGIRIGKNAVDFIPMTTKVDAAIAGVVQALNEAITAYNTATGATVTPCPDQPTVASTMGKVL